MAWTAGTCWPRPVLAEEKARLVYVRGAGANDCPSEVQLRLWVIARLGYDPFSPQASRVVIARIEGADEQLQGSVEVADHQGVSTGRRELSSKAAQCQELARALALSISLAIDPERASAAPTQPAPAREPEPAPPAEPRAPVDTPSTTQQSVPGGTDAWRFSGGAGFVGASGVLPGPALGGFLAFGFRRRWLSLAVEGRALKALPYELQPRGELAGSLLGAGLATCGHLDAFRFCAVGQLARQSLSSSGVTRSSGSSAPYAALGARLGWARPFARNFALMLGLEGSVNLTRNSAALNVLQVWKAPSLSGALTGGIETRFP
jgi:hypothetical protein